MIYNAFAIGLIAAITGILMSLPPMTLHKTSRFLAVTTMNAIVVGLGWSISSHQPLVGTALIVAGTIDYLQFLYVFSGLDERVLRALGLVKRPTTLGPG
jgi:hypothetical protein